MSRSGAGVRMTVIGKDCAQGGSFQMEVERDDATNTAFSHVLAPDVFFYDNPSFRNRQGETFQSRSQVKGRGLNVGFPSPVPAAYRFSPRS